MNKRLVKRVAVASLAALMAIPNLNMPVNNASTVYAAVTDPGLLKSIKKCQDLIEKYKAEGNEVGVKTWTKNLENTMRNAEESQKIIDESNRRKAASEQRQAEANAKQAEAERIANLGVDDNYSDNNGTDQQVKGSYVNDIERVKSRINKLNEEIANAKINNPSMVEFLEKDLFQENEELELCTLLQQYIIDEDPNVSPELIKKWNIHKLTGVERYIWYGRTEPLKITDDFIVYEDKTEFNFYYDKYDSMGRKIRVFGAVNTSNNYVKTNLDTNRYTVRSLSLPGEYHYIVTDNMPNYNINYKRDDMNIRIDRIYLVGNIIECDYQVFDFTIECPLSVPENGSRVFHELVFEPNDINLYSIKRSDYSKDEYYDVYEGIQVKDNEELSKGTNNYEIARKLTQTEVYPPTNKLTVSHEKISAKDILIKKLEYRVKYINKQASLGLAPEWDDAVTR